MHFLLEKWQLEPNWLQLKNNKNHIYCYQNVITILTMIQNVETKIVFWHKVKHKITIYICKWWSLKISIKTEGMIFNVWNTTAKSTLKYQKIIIFIPHSHMMDLILYTLHTLFCSFTVMYQSHPYSRHLILYRLTSKVLELNEDLKCPSKRSARPSIENLSILFKCIEISTNVFIDQVPNIVIMFHLWKIKKRNHTES